MRALGLTVIFLLSGCASDGGPGPDAGPREDTERLSSPAVETTPVEPPEPAGAEETQQATFSFLLVSGCCGKGNATLIEAPGATILVDAGYPRDDRLAIDLLPMLAGVERFDLVVGTHPHQDHIGQLADVLDGFEVGAVWMVGSTPPPGMHLRAHEAAAEAAGEWREPRAGEVHRIGDLTIDVLHPATLLPEHLNDDDLNRDSIVMRITYGTISLLLTGDALHSSEAEMLEREHDLRADILELGHHGIDDATSSAWVTAVSPMVAIYSANDPDIPNETTVDNLGGVPLYGTGLHGKVVVTTDREKFSVTTEHDEAPIRSPDDLARLRASYEDSDSTHDH